jgi:dsDNA-specific endonuclease/ATPase MutS2
MIGTKVVLLLLFTKTISVQYKTGDKISFLNQPGTGVVKNILSNFRLVVTNEDGFDITVTVKEIVPFKEESVYTINAKYIDEKEKHELKLPRLKKEDIWEVDLHLHEITDTRCFMTDHEKLQYQLKYFRKCMDEAVINGIKKIIFIHGVGKGTLKQEIVRALKDYERVKHYEAPFKKYGFGATMVEFY